MPKVNGWIRDLPDARDKKASDHIPLFYAAKAPAKLDLRPACPPIYDQKALGSCTAQAVCAVLQFTEKEVAKGAKVPVPSRLFTYWHTRFLQGTEDYDSGASLRYTIKSVKNSGYLDERFWPYTDWKDRFTEMPPDDIAAIALQKKLKVSMYARVEQFGTDIKPVLAAYNPVVFGFAVYDKAMKEAGKTGVHKMPDLKGDKIVGGHAVVLVGYDDNKGTFLVRNSWGKGWGTDGYYTMPYDFVLDERYASDFWTIKAVPA